MASVLKFLFAACGVEVKLPPATFTFPCNERGEELLIIMLLLVPFTACHLMWEKKYLRYVSSSPRSMDRDCMYNGATRGERKEKRIKKINHMKFMKNGSRMEMKRMARLFVFRTPFVGERRVKDDIMLWWLVGGWRDWLEHEKLLVVEPSFIMSDNQSTPKLYSVETSLVHPPHQPKHEASCTGWQTTKSQKDHKRESFVILFRWCFHFHANIFLNLLRLAFRFRS